MNNFAKPTMRLANRPSAALAAVALAMLAGAASGARADDRIGVMPPPEGVVSLSSSATVEVPRDWMAITFSTTRDGSEAAGVQAAVKEAVDAALALARKSARGDGHVEVQTGDFSLQPRITSKGLPSGWTGRGEIVVQGRDMATIAELAGHISTLTIAHVDYSVSREAREKVEGDLAAQAIARFRAKAADYARAFGYAGFVVREVAVTTDAAQPPVPRMYAMKAMAPSASDEALPVEAGKGAVTSTVSGTVQMK
jgi:predicted secreted protein